MISLHKPSKHALLTRYIGVVKDDGIRYALTWCQYVRGDGTLRGNNGGFIAFTNRTLIKEKERRLEGIGNGYDGWVTMKLKDVIELLPLITAYKIGDKIFDGGGGEIVKIERF